MGGNTRAPDGTTVYHDVCGPSGEWCLRVDGDCGACSRSEVQGLTWICSFCVVGKRGWEGSRRDTLVPGAYTSGVCCRCGWERILLLGVNQPR